MSMKKIRQKYFVSKELRLSIAIIILWSLLITAFFTYFAKELSSKIGHGALMFFIIMAGYVIIVVVLTMLFSHRLIGPFQRLKTEIRLIEAGDYRRRLNVRTNDDIYIRSFISEINKMLNGLEGMHQYRENINKEIDSELLKLLSDVEAGEPSKEHLRERILSLHNKLKSLLDNHS
jgi:nitrogen fixation/metabolism regulation signal transduction histidine kinase